MDDVIVDACCLINLFAAGDLGKRLYDIGGVWYVPSAVLAETYYLHIERADGSIDKSPIDLQPLVIERVLHTCEPAPGDELDLYVSLAAKLDDGEAMALAIAKTRAWTLATDDRKAQRLATELSVQLLSTSMIMHRWWERAVPTDDELSDTLQRIERLSRYSPGAREAHYSWWRKSI